MWAGTRMVAEYLLIMIATPFVPTVHILLSLFITAMVVVV